MANLLAVLLLYRSVSRAGYRKSIFGLVRTVAGDIAMRYPSVGLNKPVNQGLYRGVCFGPAFPSEAAITKKTPRVSTSAGMVRTTRHRGFEPDHRLGFEGVEYALSAVLHGQ